MLDVYHLSKTYTASPVIRDLSFHLDDHVIYGFLGPNGAGKSTVMNMLAGCIAPTGGGIRLNGHDVFAEPMYGRTRIGYLPELPPLYPEMTPREYLRFAAGAKGLDKRAAAAQTEELMDALDLGSVRDRLIRSLSKGFRQRVGIAQAILGAPELLLLDEPTVGLDPHQLADVRRLLRGLRERCTIFFSSHILSEVAAICDQILILYRGELVAFETPEALEARLHREGHTHLLVEGAAEAVRRAFAAPAEVPAALRDNGNGTFTVTLPRLSEREKQREVFHRCVENGLVLLEMEHDRGSLEDVFLALTGPAEGGEAS